MSEWQGIESAPKDLVRGTREYSLWLQENCCPICSLLLDDEWCHECGSATGKKPKVTPAAQGIAKAGEMGD